MNNTINLSNYRTRHGGILPSRTDEPACPSVTLKNGLYHKMTHGDQVIVDGIAFKIPQKNLQTFVEVDDGKVYIVNLDGERISEALERADAVTGEMRSRL